MNITASFIVSELERLTDKDIKVSKVKENYRSKDENLELKTELNIDFYIDKNLYTLHYNNVEKYGSKTIKTKYIITDYQNLVLVSFQDFEEWIEDSESFNSLKEVAQFLSKNSY